ncbi:MAG: NINE protein [Elainella sp.]
MRQVNAGTAYIVWLLCAFGICGGQRFYTGRFASGTIYLFTFGLFGIGQLLDLRLIPGMVERRNLHLRGLADSYGLTSLNSSVTLNLGTMSQLKQLPPFESAALVSATPMQRLLRAAQENGGVLSLAQAALHTGLDLPQVKQLLFEMERNGIAEIGNDPETGAIRYHFDIYRLIILDLLGNRCWTQGDPEY